MNLTNFLDQIPRLKPDEYAPTILSPGITGYHEGLFRLAALNLDEGEAWVSVGNDGGKSLVVASLFSADDNRLFGMGFTDQALLDKHGVTAKLSEGLDIEEDYGAVGVVFFSGYGTDPRVQDVMHRLVPKMSSQGVVLVNRWSVFEDGATEAARELGLAFVADPRLAFDVGVLVKDVERV